MSAFADDRVVHGTVIPQAAARVAAAPLGVMAAQVHAGYLGRTHLTGGLISMKPATSPSALRVQHVLGDRFQVLEFDESTRTAAEAAAAIGCAVPQIAKSLVFRTAQSGRPVLVVASGANRVDEKRVAALVGEPITRADAEFVRNAVGFSIGGVPPVAHKTTPIVLIDEALSAFAEIWAAAGTPNAVFKLTAADLVTLTGGRVAAVAQVRGGP